MQLDRGGIALGMFMSQDVTMDKVSYLFHLHLLSPPSPLTPSFFCTITQCVQQCSLHSIPVHHNYKQPLYYTYCLCLLVCLMLCVVLVVLVVMVMVMVICSLRAPTLTLYHCAVHKDIPVHVSYEGV